MTTTPSERRTDDPGARARILLVDPHPVSRRGLAAFLGRVSGLSLVAGVGRIADVTPGHGAPWPGVDLVVVEPLVAPNGMKGLIAELSRIAPGAAIVALSAHDEPGFVERVRDAGVVAFLSKTLPAAAIVQSIRRVLADRGVSGTTEEEEPSMTQDHVYKKIEVTGSSTEGIEDAVRQALARTAKSVRKMRWFEIVDMRGHIDDADVAHWQVTVKIGFTLEDE
jgi:flavin-binding protein dodecin/CheY-like chemotaxis protein